MTTFKSPFGRTLQIGRHVESDKFQILFGESVDSDATANILNNDDGAAIALSVMEAASTEKRSNWEGDRGSALYARNEAMNWLMTARDRAAKETEAAAEAADRNRRRDELSAVLPGGLSAMNRIETLIDLIIDREDRIADLEAKSTP